MNRDAAAFTAVVSRSHLPALDGLRAVAVFTVVASHAEVLRVPGDLGVSAFFVLSGFLITRLLIREHETTGDVSKRNFYMRRTMRIFPAYYAFLLFSFLLDGHAGQHWPTDRLVSALTYTVNYYNAVNHHPTTSIAHAWSLAVEEQFYLLWPVVFVALASRGRRAVVTGLITMGLATAAWRSWLIIHSHVDVAYVYNAFDTRFDNLAVGCLLAAVVDYRGVANVARSLARNPWFAVVTLVLLLVSRLAFTPSYHYSIGFTVDAILVAVLIAQLLQLYATPLWSWLEWPAVRYLGVISYPIYLYHQWGASIGRRLPGDNLLLDFVAGVVATVVLASGSYYVIERPFLRLKKRFSAEERKGVPARPIPESTPALVVTA